MRLFGNSSFIGASREANFEACFSFEDKFKLHSSTFKTEMCIRYCFDLLDIVNIYVPKVIDNAYDCLWFTRYGGKGWWWCHGILILRQVISFWIFGLLVHMNTFLWNTWGLWNTWCEFWNYWHAYMIWQYFLPYNLNLWLFSVSH